MTENGLILFLDKAKLAEVKHECTPKYESNPSIRCAVCFAVYIILMLLFSSVFGCIVSTIIKLFTDIVNNMFQLCS